MFEAKIVQDLQVRAYMAWRETELLDMPVAPPCIGIDHALMRKLVSAAKYDLDQRFAPEISKVESPAKNFQIYSAAPEFLYKVIAAAGPKLYPHNRLMFE